MSGTGGDETFLGYPRHLGFQFAKRWARIPGPLRRGLVAPLIKAMPESTTGNSYFHRLSKRARRVVDADGLPDDARYASWLTYFDAPARAAVCGVDWVDAAPEKTAQYVLGPFRDSRAASPEGRMFTCDLQSFLPYNQLTYMDRMSMATSLEARVPLCDPELVELSATIDPYTKLRHGEPKAVLKAACQGLVPAEVLRRKKVGFDAPVGLWIKRDLAGLLPRWLSAKHLMQTGVFNHEGVQALLSEHLRGARDYSLHLWAILFFEVWHAMYIKLSMTEAPNCSLEELLQEIQ